MLNAPLSSQRKEDIAVKKYLYEGAYWHFEEGRQPNGAVEVFEEDEAGTKEKAESKAVKMVGETAEKTKKPANKARKAATK